MSSSTPPQNKNNTNSTVPLLTTAKLSLEKLEQTHSALKTLIETYKAQYPGSSDKEPIQGLAKEAENLKKLLERHKQNLELLEKQQREREEMLLEELGVEGEAANEERLASNLRATGKKLLFTIPEVGGSSEEQPEKDGKGEKKKEEEEGLELSKKFKDVKIVAEEARKGKKKA